MHAAGGLFLWAKLPDAVDAAEIARRALADFAIIEQCSELKIAATESYDTQSTSKRRFIRLAVEIQQSQLGSNRLVLRWRSISMVAANA